MDCTKPKMNKVTALCLPILLILLVSASCIPAASYNAEPETIYGVMPVDLVQNDMSKKYFPLLVEAYKESIDEPDNAAFSRDEYPFQLFAVEPFENGALLFAGYTIDQGYSNLYYMEGDKILFQATDAEFFSLNYTVFKNHTVSYGYMIDEEDKLSVKTVGTFASGETVERTSKLIENHRRGYILIAEGQTWLSSIQFLGKDNEFVTDHNSNEIGWNQSSYHWKGKPTYVWNVQRYTQMLKTSKHQLDEYKPVFRCGEYEGEMNYFVEDGSAGIQYVWRGHNNLWNEAEMIPSEKFSIDNLPANAEVYWVNIDEDDGSIVNPEQLMAESDFQAPTTPGSYCLLVITDGLVYTRFIVVK